ncbi:MAG: histidinol-phosphate aminotransferase family protein [Nitrospirae bacterium]|nr:MAG: histidinol-phosphate aminotransferase family protein [Nitrospirota bacterium]
MEKDIYTFAAERDRNLSRVVDASAGTCALGPSKKVKAAIRKAVRDVDLYPDPNSRRLRKFFSSKFGIPEDCFLFGRSVQGLLELIPSVLRPGTIRIAGPALPLYRKAAAGYKTEVILTSDAAADKDAGPVMLKGLCVKGDLLLISNPNRMTGRMADRRELFEVLSAVAESGSYVVLDESLVEFTGDDQLYERAGASDNIIVIRTTAHFFGVPGLELAYAVSSPATILRLQEHAPAGVNILAATAAMTALKDKTYIKTAKKFTDDERRALFSGLRKIPGMAVCASDSNVFLLKIDGDAAKVMSGLSRAGFLIRDCSDIDGLGNGFLRLSILSHDMNKKLLRVLKETMV